MAQTSVARFDHETESHWVPLCGKTRLWEAEIDSLGRFERIDGDNRKIFFKLLRQESDVDSYLTSPAYYTFTGRKGLWIYREGNSFIPLCWHPNVPGQILIFPARGPFNDTLLRNLLRWIPEPPCGLRLARVERNTNTISLKKSFWVNSGRSVIFAPVIEHVLDWKFPVRVLSTEIVSKMEGSSFRYIRNHVKRIRLNGAKTIKLHDVLKSLLDDFVVVWANSHAENKMSANNLVELYRKILTFSCEPALAVDGFVILINGKVEALSMWDVSNVSSPTANRFVNLCNTHYRGLADFSTQQMAEQLFADGIKYMNIGGAETESLDRFKRKFMPAYSVNLHSVEVVFQESDDFSLASRLHHVDQEVFECLI